MTQVIIMLCAIALVMAVLALVGVGIIMRNIKDKPDLTIDYDGADRAGLTDNDEEEEK